MKYVAKPVVVDAFKILKVHQKPPDVTGGLYVDLEDGQTKALATAEMCARMIPKEGDYWVVQEDGYVYLNPKDVFERKYQPLSEAPDVRLRSSEIKSVSTDNT